MRHIAAAEPHTDAVRRHLHFRVAYDFRVPRLGTGKRRRIRVAPPLQAVRRKGKAEPPVFLPVAARVEHPPAPVRGPYRGLSQTVFVKGTCRAKFEDGARAEFFPLNAIARPCDAEPLPPRTVLTEIGQIEPIASPKRVRVGYGALVPTSARPAP